VSARTDVRLPRSGSLRENPFEWLLFRSFCEERTLALVLRKRQIRKTLWIERGAPVECLSNLRHETFGQFLLGRGRITNAEFKDCLSEAACRELRFGEVAVERGLLTPEELGEAVRQNLAYKLLECFTWDEGEFRFEPWIPETTDAAAVRTPRVVFTGITKFVPSERVAAALGPLLERPLVLVDQDRVALGDLRTSPRQEALLRRLRRPTDAHELFQAEAESRDELARTLYACSLMGLVRPAEAEAARPGDASCLEPAAPEVDVDLDVPDLEAGSDARTPWALRAEIEAEHRALAEAEAPARALGFAEDGAPAELRARYVELCRRYAPERFESPELAPVADRAAELLHATTCVWEWLRRREPAPERAPAPKAAPDAATGSGAPEELAPADDYRRQALERMLGGNFGAAAGLWALALRSDPGDRASRVQLAYARFRESPECAAESLATLEEVLATAPRDALAHLFAAEIAHALEALDRAAEHFRAGCAAWERAAGAAPS